MAKKLDHIAFIMDGNNRWSKKKNLSLFESYKSGANKLLQLSNYLFFEKDINNISAFALSTNNLKRPKRILKEINKVINHSLNRLSKKNDNNFRIRFIGDLKVFDKNTILKIKNIEKINNNKKKILNIYINFGGQEEIVNIINFFRKSNSKITIKKIHNEYFQKYNFEPDILIRTGGYKRLSNFTLFNMSFTELYFQKKLWPELTFRDLNKIISQFHKTERKFGI